MRKTPAIPEISLDEANGELASLEAGERIGWAVDRFGGILMMSSSFGIQSAVLLHMATRRRPEIPVVFIDTGYHFEETYHFVEALTERLKLNLKVYHPQMTAARQEALFGRRWEMEEKDLKAYNLQNKVEPMNRALKELGARGWISGLRRSQSDSRRHLQFIELQHETYKIYPILDWDNRKVHRYLTEHELPYHPLWELGYVSIGDRHSTQPLQPGMIEADTRFNGIRRECGLHEESGQIDFQI